MGKPEPDRDTHPDNQWDARQSAELDWELAQEEARRTTASGSGFPVYDLDALAELPPPEWLLPMKLPTGFTVLYGEPGTGKTFVALDWALGVASGCWPAQQGPVVYFAGEGVSGLSRRVAAWRESVPDQYKPDAFFVVPRCPALLDPDDVERLFSTVYELEPAPKLIVIDTWARALTPGGDENSSQDVGAAVRVLDQVREETHASILILHHVRKGADRERGSTALRGAADCMWRISTHLGATGALHRMTCDKIKDGEQPPDYDLELRKAGQSAAVWPNAEYMYRAWPGRVERGW